MRITAFLFSWLIVLPLSGQTGNLALVQSRDSINCTDRYIELVKKARDTMGYVQMIHYYEMARNCDDYSPERFPENWIDTVRHLQQEALEEQVRTNRLISAGNLALRSINSTDQNQKIPLALAAYDTLDDRLKKNILSSPTILEALHDAYRSANRFPETFLRDGIRKVASRDDTTVWLENGRGRYYLVGLDEDGYQDEPAARPVVWPSGMLVYDFEESHGDSALVFGGVHPSGRNRIRFFLRDQGLFNLTLPETATSVYALKFLEQKAVFAASDNRVRAFIPNRDKKYEELFSLPEKITALAVQAKRLYIGTAAGNLFEWQRGFTTPTQLFNADTARQITKLMAAGDGPDSLLAAGYTDGSIRTFTRRNGRLEQTAYFPVHRDFITSLRIKQEDRQLAAVSLDRSVSLVPLSSAGGKSAAPLLLKYSAASAPVGAVFSNRHRCLYIFLKNGKVEVLHLDPTYYVEALTKLPSR